MGFFFQRSLSESGFFMKYNSIKTGDQFGRLTAMDRSGKQCNSHYYRYFKCDCGNVKEILENNVMRGCTQSCGCLHNELLSKRCIKHRQTKSRLYRIWSLMKHRCLNKNNKNFSYYGGRGIKVCEQWINNFISFRDWAITNGYQSHLSIDRIDNNGNYCPDNCRWITLPEQQKNKRNTIKFNGECAKDASIKLGGCGNLVSGRMRLGWTKKEAFTKTLKHKIKNEN